MNSYKGHPGDPIENLAIGKIVEVDGTHIVAELNASVTELSRIYSGEVYPIGQFGSIVKVHFGRRIIYAFVGRLRMKAEFEAERGIQASTASDERVIEADLFGEGEWKVDSREGQPELHFDRGVADYPLPQQTLYLTPKSELRAIYSHHKSAVIQLGEHVGSGGAPCFADINEMLGKHTAVLGSTGAGKSATVALILRSLIERGTLVPYETWHPRIVVLDPHNEYGAAFPSSTRLSTEDGTLQLPYWLLNLQETITLLVGRTEFAATSQANVVKHALDTARREAASILGLDENAITVDSPVPYILDTFRRDVEAQRTGPPSQQTSYNSVLQKLEILQSDARMGFLMSNWDPDQGDPFAEIMGQIIGSNSPIRIVNLSGVPNEVAGVASSVIARTLFNLKVWQTNEERDCDPVLLVCEEAHRYVPNRGEAQYEAAQESIRRIAKEGRKYGVGLLLVSQRPSEVEATVLSSVTLGSSLESPMNPIGTTYGGSFRTLWKD